MFLVFVQNLSKNYFQPCVGLLFVLHTKPARREGITVFSKTISLAVLAGVVAMLGGCATKSPIPLAENFELTVQPKVRSAGHWDLLSRDVVAQTLETLERAGVDPNSQLYVAMPHSPSDFDAAFRDFLITKLVQTGAGVRQSPDPTLLEVTYHTQVVRHNSDRPHFIPGQFTMLASGLMAAYGLHNQHIDVKLLATLGLTSAMDYTASVYTGGPTNTEMILTTTVTHGGQYIARKTDVYYLENVDAPLFMSNSFNKGYRSINMKVVAQ